MSELPGIQAQIASLPVAVLLLGPDRMLHGANPAAEAMLGMSAARMRNRPSSDILRFEDARLLQALTDGESNLSARAVELRVSGAAARQVHVALAPINLWPGWQMLVISDSSAGPEMFERTLAGGNEIALRAPEILSHEIKNPLAAIRGAAQLLDRKASDSDRALTRLIANEVDRIAALIDQMQSLSRKTTEAVEPCNIHEVIDRARAVVRAAKGEDVKFTEEFDPSIPLVLGQRDALVQILLNLLTNAVEACRDQDVPQITIATRFASGIKLRLSESNAVLRLPVEVRISDNGPGVPENVREHLFSPFVTSKKNGQGLGLALVQKLVRDMNGRIVHERDAARGITQFRLFLPIVEQAPVKTDSPA